MAPACRILLPGGPAPGAWTRAPGALVATPAGAAPVSCRLEEVTGISGDGFRVSLALPAGAPPLELDRLGADGPPLLEGLRREWLPLRARALRLADVGKPPLFAGAVAEGAAARPFLGFPAGDLFLYACEGADLSCLFLPHLAAVAFDAAAYTVAAAAWDGARTVFSRLAGATDDFFRALSAAREGLASRAADTLARQLPTLAPPARAALGVAWLPGRLLSLAALETAAPGFAAAFRDSWLAASPRRSEGGHLLAGPPPQDLFLGYRDDAGTGGPGGDAAATPLLWLLARRGPAWLLEVLSHEDYATYRFAPDPAVPALVDELLCLPQFSREALYLPLAELAGDRGELAVPARDLPLLVALRRLFAGRVIHSSPDAWAREVG